MIDLNAKKTDLTAIELAVAAARKLKKNGNALARRDAELMLAHVLSIEPANIPLFDGSISTNQLTLFDDMVARRHTGEPVAYITGEQGFWSLDFYVNQHTLIPRPDTELLVEVGLELLENQTEARVADLGTGSGCILLSILFEHPQASGVGADVSAEALNVANRNAERHELDDRARFVQSDWFDELASEEFDLIVSNPPYIPAADISGLMTDVRDFEPALALDGGDDGLDYYRHISRCAAGHLVGKGHLAFEVGVDQFFDICSIMEGDGFTDIQTFADLAGINRVVIGKKSKES